MSGHWRRRLVSLVVTGVLGLAFMLGIGCGSGDAPASKSPCGEPGLLDEMISRWEAFAAPLDDLPRPEKRTRIESFVSTISLDDLRAVCCQGVDRSDRETRRLLRRLTRAKLEFDPPPAGALAELVADTTAAATCRDMVVRVAQDRRDEMTREEGDVLSDALLDRADQSLDPLDTCKLELWAAQFGTTDRLLSRMHMYLRSEEGETRRHGARMAGESRDPRAADLLMDPQQ